MRIPEKIWQYVQNGTRLDRWLAAIMSNDLALAVVYASPLEKHLIVPVRQLVYMAVPAGAHGRSQDVTDWERIGGAFGYETNVLRRDVVEGLAYYDECGTRWTVTKEISGDPMSLVECSTDEGKNSVEWTVDQVIGKRRDGKPRNWLATYREADYIGQYDTVVTQHFRFIGMEVPDAISQL